MKSPEWFAEFRQLLLDHDFSKSEILALIVFIGILLRLPTLLKHRREMAVIKADFALKGAKLDAKLEQHKAKRVSKSLKGKK